MTETDRTTLLHAAELLEREAGWYRDLQSSPRLINDLIATARALREMAE